ncbi:MAG TPA: hypothetical protein VKR26_17395, partial [Terriglobales bacterium]|nr:hypothetical protein [Terriglobales bacterium]
MTGAYADVLAVENRLVTEMLRRVASVRSVVAMVVAEALSANEQDLTGLARLLELKDSALTLRL